MSAFVMVVSGEGRVWAVQVVPPLVVPTITSVPAPWSVKPAARHTLVEGQTMPPTPVTPVGTVCEFHVDPPLVVPRKSASLVPYAAAVASHTVVDAQAMLPTPRPPLVETLMLCAVQIVPPLMVPRMDSWPELFSPSASQTLVDGQVMAKSPVVPAGGICAVQVDPPSVVPMMAPPLSEPPTASHTDGEGHTIAWGMNEAGKLLLTVHDEDVAPAGVLETTFAPAVITEAIKSASPHTHARRLSTSDLPATEDPPNLGAS